MSALGQKQTYAVHKRMSALPPIATSIAFFGMSALGGRNCNWSVGTTGTRLRNRNFFANCEPPHRPSLLPAR
jgi:hypothetical protein